MSPDVAGEDIVTVTFSVAPRSTDGLPMVPEIGVTMDVSTVWSSGRWTAATNYGSDHPDWPNWSATGATRDLALINLVAARIGARSSGGGLDG